VNVAPPLQLRLLDLQEIDSALARLSHRRMTLPEIAQIAGYDARGAELRSQIIESRTALDDIAVDQRRLDTDIDTVRNRAARDEQRLLAGGVPSKELEGLQHEISTLARRQSVLEDEVLEIMERIEVREADLAGIVREQQEILSAREEAVARRDVSLGEIERESADHVAERAMVAAELPAELLALYEKVRVGNGGVGAAALHQRRCEGCRLELAGSELSAVRSTAPDAIVRCENCRRILIRTRDSGL
jgi:predicted  nucleic acid-binding Zn-ribbon protein